MTVIDSLAWGRGELERSGVVGNGRDCEILLEHAIGKGAAWLLLNRDRKLPMCVLASFKTLVFRRALGIPVQYLTGSTEFFGMELKVGPGVYIPKRETEGLVEEALEFLDTPQKSDLTWGKSSKTVRVHDIGTGTGAIAIAIARHAPLAAIFASDLSRHALSLAHENAELNGVADRIGFHRGDLQSPLPGIPDLVVANLPYIDMEGDAHLPAEVRIQPRSALFSGYEGLDHVHRLLANVRIKPGGRILLEIGYDQAKAVETLCVRMPKLRIERTVKDLAGLDRIAVIAAV